MLDVHMEYVLGVWKDTETFQTKEEVEWSNAP
jgi:hypothetical protein